MSNDAGPVSNQTQAVQNMIVALERVAATRQHGKALMSVIFDAAQLLVNEDGYAYDVAIAIACKALPCTQHVPNYAYRN